MCVPRLCAIDLIRVSAGPIKQRLDRAGFAGKSANYGDFGLVTGAGTQPEANSTGEIKFLMDTSREIVQV